jgi:DNA invertase Pin-like site-specific DNA recombinase
MAKAKQAALYLRVSTGEQTVENQRADLLEATETSFQATHVGDMSLKGFGRPMAVFNVLQLRHGPVLV